MANEIQEAATAFGLALVNLIKAHYPASPAQPAEAPVKATRAKKTESASSEPAAAAVAPAEVTVTAKQVADAILQLAADKGREAAVAVLAKFKAQRVSDLKPALYQEALKAATDAMAGVAEPASDSLV